MQPKAPTVWGEPWAGRSPSPPWSNPLGFEMLGRDGWVPRESGTLPSTRITGQSERTGQGTGVGRRPLPVALSLVQTAHPDLPLPCPPPCLSNGAHILRGRRWKNTMQPQRVGVAACRSGNLLRGRPSAQLRVQAVCRGVHQVHHGSSLSHRASATRVGISAAGITETALGKWRFVLDTEETSLSAPSSSGWAVRPQQLLILSNHSFPFSLSVRCFRGSASARSGPRRSQARL